MKLLFILILLLINPMKAKQEYLRHWPNKNISNICKKPRKHMRRPGSLMKIGKLTDIKIAYKCACAQWSGCIGRLHDFARTLGYVSGFCKQRARDYKNLRLSMLGLAATGHDEAFSSTSKR